MRIGGPYWRGCLKSLQSVYPTLQDGTDSRIHRDMFNPATSIPSHSDSQQRSLRLLASRALKTGRDVHGSYIAG